MKVEMQAKDSRCEDEKRVLKVEGNCRVVLLCLKILDAKSGFQIEEEWVNLTAAEAKMLGNALIGVAEAKKGT